MPLLLPSRRICNSKETDMTVKLYDNDSFLQEFTATVKECGKTDEGYKILLDKTAFFPTSGGQTGDKGTLSGVRVYETVIEGEEIYHLTKEPLEKGSEVSGKIDFYERFIKMQNHTAEHIVSGILHKLYSIDNVGFALTDNHVTLDTSLPVNEEMLRIVEDEANRVVWRCLEVTAKYPDEKELAATEYRYKKDLKEKIRLVYVENTDCCACCAPQVKNTGQIGIIKLLDFEAHKGGSRIYMVAGGMALEDFRTKYRNVKDIAVRLSAKQENAAEAVEKLESINRNLEHKIEQLGRKLCEDKIAQTPETDGSVAIFGEFNSDQQKYIANSVKDRVKAVGVFSPTDNGFSYTVVTSAENLMTFVKQMNAALSGRGGGRECLASGRVVASEIQIREWFNKQ